MSREYLVSQCIKLLREGYTIPEIANMLNIEESEIRKIIL